MRTVGVVLAGGVGARVGLDTPKQLLKIAGKPIIEHTLETMSAATDIDEIVVLMAPGFVDDVEQMVRSRRFTKVSAVIEGGATRNETTKLALAALGGEDCNVLLHDAVRPLVSQRIIRECVNALRHYEAIDVCIPSADTIVEVEGEVIAGIPQRSRLRRGQTPQGFRLSTLRRAYELADEDGYAGATDDCGVVLRYLPEVEIYVVEGSENNIKVTAPIDLFLADKLFQLASAGVDPLPSATAYEEELRGRVVVVFGSSSGIGAEVVRLLEGYGASVFGFSRSDSDTHLEQPDHIEQALRHAFDEAGRIDYVVVTAGMLRTGALADSEDEAIEQMVRVNYLGPIRIARLARPYLASSQGQLLFFASSSYTRGRAGYAVYSSSKAAIVNLTQALSEEWLPDRIRVNCINPERTATPMRLEAFGEEPAALLLDPATVAQASVDVLVSAVTGQVIDVRKPATSHPVPAASSA